MNCFLFWKIDLLGDCLSYHFNDKGQTEYDSKEMSFLKCHLDNYLPHEGALRLNWPRAGHLDFEEIRKRPEQTSRQLRPPTADENNISGDSFPNS